jgi:hypothetical protein
MKISLKRTIPIDKLNADYPTALATFMQSSQDQRLAKVKYPQCIFPKKCHFTFNSLPRSA